MRKKTQIGVAVVEFSLSLIVFFVFLFAIIEFGRAMILWNFASEVTYRASRILSICDGYHSSDEEFNIWLKGEMLGLMTFTGQAMYYDGLSGGTKKLGSTADWLKYEYYPSKCISDDCEYVKVRFSGVKIKLNLFIFDYEINLPDNNITAMRESMTIPTSCPFR